MSARRHEPPVLSVVVVAYDMDRELPRTVTSLLAPYQRAIAAEDYELVIVDNGSPVPVRVDALLADHAAHTQPDVRVLRIDDASPSPAAAANRGVEATRGELVCLIVDGARLASAGLLAAFLQAARCAPNPVISPLAWHLGPGRHVDAARTGHTRAGEDALLERIDWRANPDALFAVSTLAASSARGYFGPMGESSALCLRRSLWDALGGVDERFALPGGGYMNHDLYRRAALHPGVELITLLGEGTFHQIHGGAATSSAEAAQAMRADYEQRHGQRYRPPERDALLFGRIPATAHRHLVASVEWLTAQDAAGTGDTGADTSD